MPAFSLKQYPSSGTGLQYVAPAKVLSCGIVAAILAGVACLTAGCDPTPPRQLTPPSATKDVAAAAPTDEKKDEKTTVVKREGTYNIEVMTTQNGCIAKLTDDSMAKGGGSFEITAHLACEDCRDPNLNKCETTSKSCFVVSVHCPPGTHVPADFNEGGPVRCFPETPSGSAPRELGSRVHGLCLTDALQGTSSKSLLSKAWRGRALNGHGPMKFDHKALSMTPH